MAGEQGFAFRSTLAFVSNTLPDQFWQNAAYPTATAQGNNAGWVANTGISFANRQAGNNPKIAGIAFRSAASTSTFRITFINGAGTKNVRVAMGDGSSGQTGQFFRILDSDNSTVLATPIPANTSSASNQFRDATDVQLTAANYAASNAAVQVTFSGTDGYFEFGGGAGGSWTVAYLYIEDVGGGNTVALSTVAWNWSGHGLTPSGSVPLAARSWNWTGAGGSLAQSLALTGHSWNWTGAGAGVAGTVALTGHSWNWTGAGATPTQQAALTSVPWDWSGHGIGIAGRAHADDALPTLYLHIENDDTAPPAGRVFFTNIDGVDDGTAEVYHHATNFGASSDAVIPAGYAHITNVAAADDDTRPTTNMYVLNPPPGFMSLLAARRDFDERTRQELSLIAQRAEGSGEGRKNYARVQGWLLALWQQIWAESGEPETGHSDRAEPSPEGPVVYVIVQHPVLAALRAFGRFLLSP